MIVLFVCTGNVFRSMIAEFSFNKHTTDFGLPHIVARSAGITANSQPIALDTREALEDLGIDVSHHRQTRLSQVDIDSAGMVIAMAQVHKDFIKKNYAKDVPLFNEVCFGIPTSIDDLWDVMPDWQSHPEEARQFQLDTVKYIYEAIPDFIRNMEKFMAEPDDSEETE